MLLALFCSFLLCFVLFCSFLLCFVLYCSALFCYFLFCSFLPCTCIFCFILFCCALLSPTSAVVYLFTTIITSILLFTSLNSLSPVFNFLLFYTVLPIPSLLGCLSSLSSLCPVSFYVFNFYLPSNHLIYCFVLPSFPLLLDRRLLLFFIYYPSSLYHTPQPSLPPPSFPILLPP